MKFQKSQKRKKLAKKQTERRTGSNLSKSNASEDSHKQVRTCRIPQSKLDAALKFLAADPPKMRPFPMCVGNILTKVSSSRKMDNTTADTLSVLEVARHCAERGRWADLMKTVAIMCENVGPYAVHGILRNALFTIVADPGLNNSSFLEGFLYSHVSCRNPGDVAYCIDKMLEVFQGITIVNVGRGRAVKGVLRQELEIATGEALNE